MLSQLLPAGSERDQAPASEPSPVKAGPPQSGPLKPEAFLARQRQLGSLCMDLLEAAKDCKNMKGLREPLTSRGFICGAEQRGAVFSVTVPADFPCYYDVVGRGYVNQNRANSLNTLLNYLRGALALLENGGAYRTEAEYNSRAQTLPKPLHYGKCIEGASQKKNGKWRNNDMFPGRDFDDLDAYRAAKKQRYEQRAAYTDQAQAYGRRR